MNGRSLVYEIGEFAGVGSVKSPLNTKHHQEDEDAGIAIDFRHCWLVYDFEDKKTIG
jgi:hypothetical protein